MSKIKQTLGESQHDDTFLDDTFRVQQRTIVSTPYIIGTIRQIFDDQLLAIQMEQEKSKHNETGNL
tara:strand:+ start:1079 stop:1276 length:198 start_codon:yes stop_codon:yes gene_type:complete